MHHIGIWFLAGKVVVLDWDFFEHNIWQSKKYWEIIDAISLGTPQSKKSENTQIYKVLIMIYSGFLNHCWWWRSRGYNWAVLKMSYSLIHTSVTTKKNIRFVILFQTTLSSNRWQTTVPTLNDTMLYHLKNNIIFTKLTFIQKISITINMERLTIV